MSSKIIPHPYNPVDLIIPHYVPNDKGFVELVGIFFAIIAVSLFGMWLYLGKHATFKSQTLFKLKICWFLACGLIHTILEGYFSLYHRTLAGEQNFLAQMWKEYGKGDSRYITSETCTVCMESITAFIDGPLAFLAVYAFITNKPYRHLIQIFLSMCQLYGDVMYFSTEITDNFQHGVMWHPVYFWFYFFFLNILWIIIPGICVVESFGCLTKAQAVIDNKSTSVTKNSKRK